MSNPFDEVLGKAGDDAITKADLKELRDRVKVREAKALSLKEANMELRKFTGSSRGREPSPIVQGQSQKPSLDVPAAWAKATRQPAKKLSELSPEEQRRKLMQAFLQIAAAKKLEKMKKNEKAFQGEAPFVPCSDRVAVKVCEAAKLGPEDVFIDLGCGDGKVVIEAAKHGCKAIGVELDETVVKKARALVSAQGSRACIMHANFKHPSILKLLRTKATVVYIYLLPKYLPAITRLLNDTLRPGTKLLAFSFGPRENHAEGTGFTDTRLNDRWELWIKPGYESIMLDSSPTFYRPKAGGGEAEPEPELLLRYAFCKRLEDNYLLPQTPENAKSTDPTLFTGWLVVEGGDHTVRQRVLALCRTNPTKITSHSPPSTDWQELRGGQFKPTTGKMQSFDRLYTPEDVAEARGEKVEKNGRVQVQQLLMYTAPLRMDEPCWKQKYAVAWKKVEVHERENLAWRKRQKIR